MTIDVNILEQDIVVVTTDDDTVVVTTQFVGPQQAALQFQDEGITLGSIGTVNKLNFTGSGLVASRSGNTVTINGSGGGGSVISDGVTIIGDGTSSNPLIAIGSSGALQQANNLSDVSSRVDSLINLQASADRFTDFTKSSNFTPSLAEWQSATVRKTYPRYNVTSSCTCTLPSFATEAIPGGFLALINAAPGVTITFSNGSGATSKNSAGGMTLVGDATTTLGAEGMIAKSSLDTNAWLIFNGVPSTGFETLVKLTSDQINNNATPLTYQDCTGLSFALASGKTYYFKFFGVYDSAAATTGGGFSINGPTNSYLGYYSNYTGGASTISQNQIRTAYDSPSSAAANGGTAGNTFIIEGCITTTASGTLIIRFVSEVSGSAITCKANMCWGRLITMA